MKKYIIAIIIGGLILGLFGIAYILQQELKQVKKDVHELKTVNAELKVKLKKRTEEKEHFFNKFIEEKEKTKVEDLGTFQVSYYNSDENEMEGGEYAANGDKLQEGHIATDWNIIPPGSVVYIDGKRYVVVDKGGYIKGDKIDIFTPVDKSQLDELGIKKAKVYMEV